MDLVTGDPLPPGVDEGLQFLGLRIVGSTTSNSKIHLKGRGGLKIARISCALSLSWRHPFNLDAHRNRVVGREISPRPSTRGSALLVAHRVSWLRAPVPIPAVRGTATEPRGSTPFSQSRAICVTRFVR
jgi:hypothetical protein